MNKLKLTSLVGAAALLATSISTNSFAGSIGVGLNATGAYVNTTGQETLKQSGVVTKAERHAVGLLPSGYIQYEFDNGVTAEAHTAIMKNMDNNAIIDGSDGKIIIDDPWTPGRNGGPYHSIIRIIKKNNEEIKEFKGPEHLFFFEAELSSQTILKEKQQVPHPGMTWEDTLGNLKVLDQWRQKINYLIKEDSL